MFKALIGIAASCLLVSFTVNAQTANCSSAASDSDGDGWGWENGASCLVVSPQSPSSGYCANASSDSDGDGWGWENGASCRVSGGTSPVNSPNNQTGTVIADFTGSLVGTEADTHTFTLSEATSVSIAGLENYNFELLLFDTSGSLIWQDSYWFGDQCLQSGSYTAQINQSNTNSLQPQNYSVSVYDQNVSCLTPSSTIDLGTSVNYAEITANGTVITSSYEDNQGITAFDRYGTRLWSLSNAAYLDVAEANTDGSIFVSYSTNEGTSHSAYVEANGNVRWTINNGFDYIYAISMNNDIAVLSTGNSLVSLNLNDGSTTFRFDYINQYSASNPRVLDDGTIITTIVDRNGSLQVVTFD